MRARRSAIGEHPRLQSNETHPAVESNQAKNGGRKEHTREQLSFNAVLDRMEDHEREHKTQQEQQNRPEQRMP